MRLEGESELIARLEDQAQLLADEVDRLIETGHRGQDVAYARWSTMRKAISIVSKYETEGLA